MLRNQRAYQFIYDWTKNRCAAAVGAWGGRMVGRAAVGLLGCLKKEQMSENALLQAAEAAKKCYLRPAADTDGWQALQPFGQTEVLVSVIVPVHNGEKDLRQCLNSILAQECGNTVEIIAVNDNSTDSSGTCVSASEKCCSARHTIVAAPIMPTVIRMLWKSRKLLWKVTR